jgi:hypothetical protein
VAISLVATLFAARADRTALDVAPAVLKAALLELPRTETVAVIRTASGTTVVVPVALIVMYRMSAAVAGAAKPTPEIRVSAITVDINMRICVSFISLLSRIGL